MAFDENKNFEGVINIHDLLREVIENKEQIFDTDTEHELMNKDEGGYIY